MEILLLTVVEQIKDVAGSARFFAGCSSVVELAVTTAVCRESESLLPAFTHVSSNAVGKYVFVFQSVSGGHKISVTSTDYNSAYKEIMDVLHGARLVDFHEIVPSHYTHV